MTQRDLCLDLIENEFLPFLDHVIAVLHPGHNHDAAKAGYAAAAGFLREGTEVARDRGAIGDMTFNAVVDIVIAVERNLTGTVPDLPRRYALQFAELQRRLLREVKALPARPARHGFVEHRGDRSLTTPSA